jgi:hypothetical protein
MFDLNVTEIIQSFQSISYQNILFKLIGWTYLEVLVFTLGIFLYAVFVYHFYKKLAKRDIFELNLEKYDLPEVKWKRLKKFRDAFFYIIKYGIVFPFYVVFWFAVLSLFLFIMAKDAPVRYAILTSITVVSAVRIASYYKEDLSHDLAKLLPLALLAITLVDPTFFSRDLLVERINALSSLWVEMLQFLVFAVLLEWVLRILCSTKSVCSRRLKPQETKQT